MSRLNELLEAYRDGEKQYREISASASCREFCTDEVYCMGSGQDQINRIGNGDNLQYMEYLIKDQKLKGKFQLIYVDPPFFSDSRYQASTRIESQFLGKSGLVKTGAYEDRWNMDFGEYIRMLTVRLLMMRDLLSDTGCLWVHLDWHAVHYVKVILDQIFGEKNFINEIIWTYKSGGANKRNFARKHDTLLFYSKTDNYIFNPQTEKSYNRGLRPYRFKGVEEYEDETGWYTIVNMKDVWSIDMVGRTSSERTGYSTQKPEKLIERIVRACSNEGDLCADFFAGSGTFGAVCGRLGRSWVMCDRGDFASAAQVYRMACINQNFILERSADSCESSDSGTIAVNADEAGIELADYKLDISGLHCSSKETVEEYYSRDSLSLVKFWGADMDYSGGAYRIDRLYDSAERKIQIKNNREGQRIVIIGYNVFGGRFSAEIHI
ncbi:MAG: DNA-methyltransferase [Lentihominibacter sp.]